jgi:hypothetical protein
MRTYDVARVEDVSLTGDTDGAWAAADAADLDQFAWTDGEGPATTARALTDGDAVYVQFQVADDEISAENRDLNGTVYKDSCVEFFAAPTPARDLTYFNFEANCVGDVHLGWVDPDWNNGRGPGGRDLVGEDLAADIEVATSVPGPTRAPAPDDESWWLAARLPVETLRAFTGRDVSVAAGTEWRANFYREGVPDHLLGTWNRVEHDEPEYHLPEQFGRLRFA